MPFLGLKSNRTLIMTYNGATAKPKYLTAGASQGTVFIVKVNGIVLRPAIPKIIPDPAKKSVTF